MSNFYIFANRSKNEFDNCMKMVNLRSSRNYYDVSSRFELENKPEKVSRINRGNYSFKILGDFNFGKIVE